MASRLGTRSPSYRAGVEQQQGHRPGELLPGSMGGSPRSFPSRMTATQSYPESALLLPATRRPFLLSICHSITRNSIVVSEAVVAECERGDPQMVERRRELLQEVSLFPVNEGILEIAKLLVV